MTPIRRRAGVRATPAQPPLRSRPSRTPPAAVNGRPLRRPARSLLTLALLSKLLALGLLLVSVWAAQEVGTSPAFEVTSVHVSGSDLVSAEEVVAMLGLTRSNVFHLRARPLAAAVESHPTVRQATVRPSLLGTVFVAVQERVPVVVWESSGQQVLADAEGLALQAGAPPSLSEFEAARALPVVHAAGASVPIGGRVDAGAIRVVQVLAPALDSLGLTEGRLEYQQGSGVSVVGPRHRVTLGSSEQIEAKLDAYRAIRHHLDESRTSAQVIDLRSPERPYFR